MRIAGAVSVAKMAEKMLNWADFKSDKVIFRRTKFSQKIVDELQIRYIILS